MSNGIIKYLLLAVVKLIHRFVQMNDDNINKQMWKNAGSNDVMWKVKQKVAHFAYIPDTYTRSRSQYPLPESVETRIATSR